MPDMPTTPENGRRRLPKYKRAPDRFGPMRLTARDLEILETILNYRNVWIDHLQALIPGSDRQLARRAQGLFHHGYLARFVPPSKLRFERGSPKFVYALATAGAKALAEAKDVPVNEIGWDTSHNRRTEWFAEHHIGVANFHTVLELALRRCRDLELLAWRQDVGIRGSVEVEFPDGDKRFQVSPDAYFAVREAGTQRNFFLEIDRGTEEHRRIFRMFERYFWYLQGPHFEQNYENPKDVRVLTVTTSPGRLSRMLKTVAAVDKKGRWLNRFWFTTQGQYQLSDPATLFKPIWVTVKEPEQPRQLFDRSV